MAKEELNTSQERHLAEKFRKRFEENMTLDEDALRNDILEEIADFLSPEEVFDEEDLIAWAEENGFTRDEPADKQETEK